MKLNTYKASDLLKLTLDELWNMSSEWHVIEFDNGETIIVKDRFTKLSVIYWNPLKHFKVPVLKEYHLGTKPNARISSNHLQDTLNNITWGIHNHIGESVDMEELSKVVIETQNLFYNNIVTRLDSYEPTLDLVDLHEVFKHPEIRKANTNVSPTTHGIENVAYKHILDTVYNDSTLDGNIIVEGLRSGTQRQDGFLQAYGPRGFPTDINSDIFPHPVLTGYVEGIWNLHDSMVESRSGTKALLYNKELLKDTEYFNRKTQLIAQYVQHIHYEDCGGHLIDFPIMKANLKAMNGTNYINPETGKLDYLRGNEKHLLGKKVKIRNVLGCIHPDPQGICSTCFGRLAYSIPKGTIVGQVSSVSLGDQITSAVLSTRHTDATSAVEQYQLGELEAKWLKTGPIEETLYLRKKTIEEGYKIYIKRTEARNLADILMIDNLKDYNIENASELTRVLVQKEAQDGGMLADMLTVSLYNRKASFSTSFLKYIKKHGWEVDDNDNIVIDIKDFDHKKPFLTLPNKHVNMYEVMLRIQAFLHSGVDRVGIRTEAKKIRFVGKSFLRNYKDPVEGLVAAVGLLNEKLNINASHCSVLVYAMMSRMNPVKDYALPKPGLSGCFEKYTTLMFSRSLGGAMAYERQHMLFNQPSSFVNPERNDHPYDRLLLGGNMNY